MAGDDARHEHLGKHRAMIVGRAAMAGAVSLLPVPVLDELLAGAVREALLARIAEARGVDVSEEAIALLADVGGDLMRAAVDASLAAAVWRRAWRRAAAALRVARRADEFAVTFAWATLFDHYCARHHVGLGVDLLRARELRAAMASSVSAARRGLVRRALRASGGVIVATPRALIATVQRRILSPGEASSRPPAEALAPDEARAARTSRAQAAAEALAAPVRLWGEELAIAFDALWTREP